MNKPSNPQSNPDTVTRRGFLSASSRTAGTVAAASLSAAPASAQVGGPDKIRIGLIGCRRRGAHGVRECLTANKNVELVAVADLFEYNMKTGLELLATWPEIQDRIKIKHKFLGIDAYKEMMQADVDVVFLETPPHFRPTHLKAAVEAGKHVFMEKPVAVDPVGARSVMASAEIARNKGLSIVAGTQRRHEARYREVIQRIHDGAIGDLVSGECYWNTGFIHFHDRKPGWSDMEFQINNWLYFSWLSGDFVVEQHVHNIDVMNWIYGHPIRATSMGGRQVRSGIERWGNVFDHFATEFVYPNGRGGEIVVTSTCRQIDGCEPHVAEYARGTKGWAKASGEIYGERPYRFEGKHVSGYLEEHAHLMDAIRKGKPINEGRQVAESSLTAIMARMSAYTGKTVTWDFVMKQSQLDYTPASYAMGPKPLDPVPIPGKTVLA